MKTSHLLLILISALLPASCGFRQADTSQLSSLPAIRPLIVGMSGYSTCTESDSYHNGDQGPLGAQLFRKIEPIFQQITDKLGVEPGLMASCFTNDSKLITASSLDGWKLTKPTDKDYLASVHQQIDFFTHVFVVGHSYGGWLSMKLAETYNGAKEKIKTMHTIDPISKELCYFDNVSECLSAPRDFDAAARGRIRDNTDMWVNAWQDTTFFLHSSPIEEADENPKYEAEHWDIDNDDDLWETIGEKIALSF
jgi:hypothetical protein